MTAFGALTKQMIKTTLLPSFKSKKERNKFIIALTSIAIAIGIPYILALVASFGLIKAAVAQGYLAEILSSIFLMSQLVTIFFSLFVYINIMYYSKDNEFLFTLPLKTASVFWAKLIALVLYELILSAVIILPVSIVAIVAMIQSAAGLTAGFVILLIPAIVLLPLMAILVIAILSYPIMKILQFFKKRPILGAVFVILFVVALYIAIYVPILYANNSAPPIDPDAITGGEADNSEMDMDQMYGAILPSLAGAGKYSYHTYFLAKAMTATSALSGFGYASAFFGIVIALAALGSLLASWQYKQLASAALEGGGVSKASGKNKEVKQFEVKRALFRKDLFSVLKNNTLLIQSGMIVILPPILVYFICAINIKNIPGSMGVIICASIADFIVKLMLSSNTASILAFSRDGEGVLSMKTMPLSAKSIVDAKINSGLVFSLLTLALSTVALMIVPSMNVLAVLGFAASNALYAYAVNRMCVYRDLKNPNIHWKNLQEIVKNNFSSVIPMLFAFIPGIVTTGLSVMVSILLNINIYALAAIYCVISTAVSAIYFLITRSMYNFDEEEYLQRVE